MVHVLHLLNNAQYWRLDYWRRCWPNVNVALLIYEQVYVEGGVFRSELDRHWSTTITGQWTCTHADSCDTDH